MPIITGFEDAALFILRVVVAIIFIKSGWGKTKDPKKAGKMIGWKPGSALVLGLFEFLGGLAILFGFYTQIAAFMPLIVILGAIYYKLFIWKKADVTLDFLILAVAIILISLGAGAASIDSLIGLA